MKTPLFILIFFFCAAQAWAEKEKAIEPAIMECVYEHQMVKDTIQRNSIMQDLMILRIGKNISQFYSEYTQYGDSLWADPMGRKIAVNRTMEAIRTKNFDNKPGTRTPQYLYKSYPEQGRTSTYALQGEHDYAYVYFTEETPQQTWEMQDSTKQVLGYTCQLATTRFRGRLWYAWFTPDIPIDNGPWKLGGLPGLIVEAYDSQNYFHYTLKGIRTKDLRPVTFYNYWEKVYEKTTRIDYLKAEHKLMVRYAKDYKHRNAYDFQETDYHEPANK